MRLPEVREVLLRLTPSKLYRGVAWGFLYFAGVGLGVLALAFALTRGSQHTISTCGDVSRTECPPSGRR